MRRLTLDIDATLAAVDNMKKNFDIVPREEAIIRAGLVLSGRANGRPKQNIQEYLGSITRLQNTLTTIPRSNMRSAEKASAQMVCLRDI
jgi:hypothetical protein